MACPPANSSSNGVKTKNILFLRFPRYPCFSLDGTEPANVGAVDALDAVAAAQALVADLEAAAHVQGQAVHVSAAPAGADAATVGPDADFPDSAEAPAGSEGDPAVAVEAGDVEDIATLAHDRPQSGRPHGMLRRDDGDGPDSSSISGGGGGLDDHTLRDDGTEMGMGQMTEVCNTPLTERAIVVTSPPPAPPPFFALNIFPRPSPSPLFFLLYLDHLA